MLEKRKILDNRKYLVKFGDVEIATTSENDVNALVKAYAILKPHLNLSSNIRVIKFEEAYTYETETTRDDCLY